MGLVRYRRVGESAAEWGWMEGGVLHEVEGDPLAGFETGSRARGDYTLLAPTLPTKIVAVGRNYAAHAQELGNPLPERPLLFLKPPSAVIADGEEIFFPPVGEEFHYEAELAVVIGRVASRVSEEEAAGHILGYTCANDLTIRDLQRDDGQWARAKGFDGSCPLGREISPELPGDARVRGYLNGELVQDGEVSDMVFGVERLVSYISQAITLLPGDVVLTGTPAGVGELRPGDEFRVEVTGVSELANPVAGRR